MGIGNENKRFITASADALINWVRTGSLWPVTT
ncbi:NADH-quinone oxidoreductase subunit B, partial [Francisella tularensis subsp. holarctica]|nr:NADH-quinone oxidoreductase subunit B [Francisella tularensis subsp. holarctica]